MTEQGPTERCRWVVTGRVQGVGFRWHVARAAQGLAVQGWVTNLEDGAVEVVAEGSPEAIGDLDQAVRKGPKAAVVERVEKSHLSGDIALPNAFEIR